MPLIATPRQFTQRAELFHQLAQLTSAGIGVIRALEQIKRSPPAPSFREPLQRLLDGLARGSTLAESLRPLGWLPNFDLALIEASEHSGRLDAGFRLLADYYNDRARILHQIIADLAYPAFLFHLAIFVGAFLQFLWSGPWLLVLLGGLIPAYAAVAFLIYAAQDDREEDWRARVESILHRVPMLGTARQCLTLSRLAVALEALISAGVNIIEAWDLAAVASGSPALRHAVAAWKPQVIAGQTPSEAVRLCPLFPETFANLYSTGEISGKLDDSLRQLHRYYNDEGARKMRAFVKLTTFSIFLVVALFVAFIVIRSWMHYFDQINAASHF